MGCVQRSEPSESRSSQQRFLPAASAGRNSRLGTPGWLRVRPDHQHPDRPARHGVCFEVLLVVGIRVRETDPFPEAGPYLKAELRRRMHEPVAVVGEWLRKAVRGYYQYLWIPKTPSALKMQVFAVREINPI